MILVIDCCLSGDNSATRKFYESYLDTLNNDEDIRVVYLEEEDLSPNTFEDVVLRDKNLANKNMDWEGFKYAKDFIRKSYLGMPAYFSIGIIAVTIIGIIIGSFSDYSLAGFFSNKTSFGEFFAHYGNVISYCFYPMAGTCLFKGFMKKGEKYKVLACGLLILGYFLAIYYSNFWYGKYIRADIGYVPGESPAYLEFLGYLIWFLLYSWVPPVTYFILDDSRPNLLITIGAVILIGGILSDDLNQWLKNIGSRPRYKYILTLDNPEAEYLNWWQIRPYFDTGDDFGSFPSGHMTKASLFFCLPMLANVLKVKKPWVRPVLIAISFFFIISMAVNRVTMQAHFLSDVCFATLISYLCYLLVYVIATSTGYDNNPNQ